MSTITPTFRDKWFSERNWPELLAEFRGRPVVQALEIGSYEGQSATWLLENILTGEGSFISCVDVFESPGGRIRPDYEEVFDLNMRQYLDEERAFKHKGRSQELLREFAFENYQLIYVDGSHFAADVLEDAVLCWRLLTVGGVLIFDDYDWGGTDMKSAEIPKTGIDGFLAAYQGLYNTLHREYQVAIRKIADRRDYLVSICPCCTRAVRRPPGDSSICPHCGHDFWSTHED